MDIVRRGGTLSIIGVYGGAADPLPMKTLFDKQIQVRMGQANVKRWVDDILPLSTDDDPLGVETSPPTGSPSRQAPPPTRTSRPSADGTVQGPPPAVTPAPAPSVIAR